MKELEEVDFDDTTKGFTKKELLIQKRELIKLQKTLGGIRNLTKTPSAIWIVDAKREHLAVNEATKLGIPVIGILDTNADPDEFQYPIPGNDDAIRSVGLLTRIIADAAAEGLIQRHNPNDDSAEATEPLADWERELLEESAPSQSSAETEKVADEGIAAADLAEAVEAEQADEGEIATETPADEAGAEAHDEAIAAESDETATEVADAEAADK
jgi:small subunit ribosomal protein S2